MDGSITFNSKRTFDFDPSNGITAGQFDFVGTATHEIGHVLGFISGVDILDLNSTIAFLPDNNFQLLRCECRRRQRSARLDDGQAPERVFRRWRSHVPLTVR